VRSFFLTILIFLFGSLLSSAWAQVTLKWPEKSEALEYHGEIAHDKDFTSPIMVFKTDKNFYELSNHKLPTKFYFRVRYVDQWQRFSHFSNTAKVTFTQTQTPTQKNEPVQKVAINRGDDFYFLGFVPSLIDSQIDSKKISNSTQFALLAGGQKRYHDSIHHLGLLYFPFQQNIEGALSSLDYRFHRKSDSFFWGPSADLMNFNVVYKDKAEISGTVLNLGAHLGGETLSAFPLIWRVDLQASYDVKGYQMKADLSKRLLSTSEYAFLTGLSYRYFTYQGGQYYRFSSLGLQLTFEK
jgi:hypothetical protein